jgi:type IV pilus assembly protein PilM
MPKLLNIEIGDSFVKICQTEKKKSGVVLRKAFTVPTPVGTAADGIITDAGLLGGELLTKLHENGMSGVKNVIFTLVSGKVATREVMLPPVKENRIKAVIEANAGDYFPVDISRYYISYGMLKTVSDGHESGSHLMVLAVPLQLLDGYIKLAKKMNLEIQGIDYGGNSQYQVVKSLERDPKKVTMCISVSSAQTLITIVRGDRLVLQRSLPFGGVDFVEAYMYDTGMEDSAYLEALEQCSVPLEEFLEEGKMPQGRIDSALSRIVGGISRSMDFFNSGRWSSALDNIILAGECGCIAGLREAVSTALGGVAVTPLHELPAPHAFAGSEPALVSQYISAYGSAFAPVDLLPDKYKTNKKEKKSSEHGLIGAIAIFAVAVIAGSSMSLFAMLENTALKEQLDDIQREIDSFDFGTDDFDRYAAFSGGEGEFALLKESVDTRNRHLAEFFAELEEKMPSDMLLLSAVCTEDGVVMSIRAQSLETAARIITEFRTFESVEQVEVSSIAEGADVAGIAFFTFSVNCLYDPPVVVTAPASSENESEDPESDSDNAEKE